MRLLVTRPEADAAHTAGVLRARGCQVTVAALLRVEALTPALGRGPWQALALTSANAARAIGHHPRHAELVTLPVFAVGRRTAAAARTTGFTDVHSADGNAGDLVRLIVAGVGKGTVLYVAGEDRAADLGGVLAVHGVSVEVAVVYRAARLARLPEEVAATLSVGGLDGVLHYSRRSAETYLDCAGAGGLLDLALAPVHFCLSEQVAEPLLKAGARQVRIAERPEERALLDLIAIT